jgi:hypothetical protein
MLDLISDAATLRMGKVRQEMEEIHLGFSFESPEPLPEDSPEAKRQKHVDETHERLLAIGYRIGWSLAERRVHLYRSLLWSKHPKLDSPKRKLHSQKCRCQQVKYGSQIKSRNMNRSSLSSSCTSIKADVTLA